MREFKIHSPKRQNKLEQTQRYKKEQRFCHQERLYKTGVESSASEG